MVSGFNQVKPLNRQYSHAGLLMLLRTLFWKKRALATFKRTKRRIDYNTFSELGAKFKRVSKSNYQSYIKNTEEMLFHKPASFWKFIRELNHSASIPCIEHSNNETYTLYTLLKSVLKVFFYCL